MSDVDAKRPRQDDSDGPQSKRPREATPNDTTTTTTTTNSALTRLPNDVVPAVSRLGLKPQLPELPPSLELVTGSKADLAPRNGFVGEAEVGIIGYVGDSNFPGVQGVIKQRYTDFLVNEISAAGEVVHLKDIGKPVEPKQEPRNAPTAIAAETAAAADEPVVAEDTDLPPELQFEAHASWPPSATAQLRRHFDKAVIFSLHALVLDGKTARRQQDGGWGARQAQRAQQVSEEEMAANIQHEAAPAQDLQRGKGRGGRQNGNSGKPQDDREVITQAITSKEDRTAAHAVIREVFSGAMESSVRDVAGTGQCLVIKWAAAGRNARQDKQARGPRLPPYIHFTLHKTNRETQDCLGHLNRILNVHSRDLTVCGTKDKRAVTVQRVCVKRGNLTLQSVWNSVNGIKSGRRTEKSALLERGERGTRIGDITYSQRHLELGMLRGNQFTVVLRNVRVDRVEDVDEAMASIRDRGFINFFGMQRFGTSTVPTHVTGLLLLQQKWGQAIDSILSLRDGEHPDCTRARLAWLEDGDFRRALEIMPRRSVTERAIWEYWSRGNRVEDKLGALAGIPRNMRTMYVHAYQSYIWNLITSERVKLSNTSALVGDLVFVDGGDDDADGETGRQVESSSAREVKILTEADVGDYSLADVILPMPGWNVEYPGGAIGKMYQDMLVADGLDPKRMRRDQREYSLPGSYRKIIHRPTNVSWEHIRYTDPDLPLSQADEDRLLGLNEPVADDPEGKFRALNISWTLGTSSYATMALREITRQETATWSQISMTLEGEDQAHKGTGKDAR